MSHSGKTQSKHRVCKIVTTNSIGVVPAYELVSIPHQDFEDHDKARAWIDDLDDSHRYSEYVILEVLKRV